MEEKSPVNQFLRESRKKWIEDHDYQPTAGFAKREVENLLWSENQKPHTEQDSDNHRLKNHIF
jgi:hypothetical protein